MARFTVVNWRLALSVMVGIGALSGCARHEEHAADYGYGSIKDTGVVRRKATAAGPDAPPALRRQPAPTVPVPVPVRERAASPAKPAVVAVPSPAASDPRIGIATPNPPAPLPTPPPAATPPEAAPPAPPKAPVVDERVVAEQLLAEGRRLFQDGSVLEARRRFVGALSGMAPEATWALAQTYDTHYVSRLPRNDATADLQRALQLYQTAVERGMSDAREDLVRARLALGLPPG